MLAETKIYLDDSNLEAQNMVETLVSSPCVVMPNDQSCTSINTDSWQVTFFNDMSVGIEADYMFFKQMVRAASPNLVMKISPRIRVEMTRAFFTVVSTATIMKVPTSATAGQWMKFIKSKGAYHETTAGV